MKIGKNKILVKVGISTLQGLGTSTSKEAKEYFVDVDDKLIKYYWEELKEESDSDSDEEESIPSIDPNDGDYKSIC